MPRHGEKAEVREMLVQALMHMEIHSLGRPHSRGSLREAMQHIGKSKVTKLNAKGKIMADTKNAWRILQLYNDDCVNSAYTGNKYIASDKDEIQN